MIDLPALFLLTLFLPAPQESVQPPWHVAGDMIGEVTPQSAIAWTRANRAASVEVLVAANPALTSPLVFGPVATGSGNSAHVKLTGLAAGTRYWYRTRLREPAGALGTTDGPVGTFVTAPLGAAKVRLGFSGDVASAASYPIFQAMRGEALDFYVSLGDMPYCDGALVADDFRAHHLRLRTAPDLQGFFASTSCYAIFDDHEVANDWDANTPGNLVKTGVDAWSEFFPVDPGPSRVFYRSFAWGSGVRLFVLDTRSYRGSNTAPDKPGHRMLGATQMAWLKRELKASTETFKLIATSVPLYSGGPSRDHWEGYLFERRELFDFLQAEKIANVVFLAADHHMAAVNYHPEGFVEVLSGPLTAFLNSPPADRDGVMWKAARAHNYAVATHDPAAQPPTLEIEVRGTSGTLLRERVVARGCGEIELSAGLGDASLHLSGPRRRAFTGNATRDAAAAAGTWRVHGATRAGRHATAPSMPVQLEPGGYAAAGVLPMATAASDGNLLLAEDFEGRSLPSGTTIHESMAGTASWFVDGGRLWQSGFHWTADAWQPSSACLVATLPTPDGVLRVQARSAGFGTAGVLLRWRDAGNWQAFLLNAVLRSAALVACTGGRLRVLASTGIRFPVGDSVMIEAGALGDTLYGALDGQVVLRATGAPVVPGRCGLAVNATYRVAFDRLRVWRQPPDERISYLDAFETGLGSEWVVHTEGQGVPRWQVSNGALRQTAIVRGPGDHRPGTSMLLARPLPNDQTVEVKLRSDAAGGIGVLFRAASTRTWYRFQMDASTGIRRLERSLDGAHRVLAETTGEGYELGRWYRVDCVALGDRLSVRLDGEEILVVRDAAISGGSAGLYCFDNDGAVFDHLRITEAASPAPVTVASGRGRVFDLRFATEPMGPTSVALVLLSAATRPAIDLVALDPGGRLLPLAADPLFDLGLNLGLFVPFDASGQASARLSFPSDPKLTGARLWAGGLEICPGRGVAPLASVPLVLR